MTNSSAPATRSGHPIRVVIDASVLVDWIVLGVPSGTWGGAVLHAPSLIDYEFAQAVRRAVRIGRLRESEGREALETLVALTITRHHARPLLRVIWSHRHEISAYDASYVALAQLLGVPLLTADRRLAHAAQRWCDVALTH